MPSLQLAD